MAKKKGGFFKRLGRKSAKVATKINRVATPVAAAAAGYLYGAPGAAAVTALGATAGRYSRATQARNEGIKGREARALGRGERKRVAIYGAIGGGAGMLGSGVTGLIRGESLLNAGGQALFGQHGSQLLGIAGNTIFTPAAPTSGLSGIVTAGNFAAQKAVAVPGLVTQAQLAPALTGGAAEAAGAGSSGASLGSKLVATLPSLIGALGKGVPMATTPGTVGDPRNWGGQLPNPNEFGFGGGGAGDSGGGSGGSFMNSPTDGDSKGGLIAMGLLAALLLAG